VCDGALAIGVNVARLVAAGTSQTLTWTASPESGDWTNARSLSLVGAAGSSVAFRPYYITG
jgi:hypothetical protein